MGILGRVSTFERYKHKDFCFAGIKQPPSGQTSNMALGRYQIHTFVVSKVRLQGG